AQSRRGPFDPHRRGRQVRQGDSMLPCTRPIASTLSALLCTLAIASGAAAGSSLALVPAAGSPAPGAGFTDSAWWGGVSRALAAREYQASTFAGQLQAPNRAQNLRTRFLPSAVTVSPRTGSDGHTPQAKDSWQWSWTTAGWGRSATATAPVSMPAGSVDATPW